MKKIFFPLVVALMGILTSVAYAADGVTTGAVNLRSGPGVKYAKRGTIPSGYRLNVNRCQGNWCRVTSSRGSGWISARYLAFNKTMAPRYRRTVPVVIIPFYIGRPHVYHYRTYRHRPGRYRTYHSRRHHGVVLRRHHHR